MTPEIWTAAIAGAALLVTIAGGVYGLHRSAINALTDKLDEQMSQISGFDQQLMALQATMAERVKSTDRAFDRGSEKMDGLSAELKTVQQDIAWIRGRFVNGKGAS